MRTAKFDNQMMELKRYNLATFIEMFYKSINKSISFSQDGGSYVACCPFHNEKTPSFHVRQNADGTYTYRCFGGCDNTSGDIVNFVEKELNVGFAQAVAKVSSIIGIGVELKPVAPEKKEFWDIMQGHQDRYIKELEEAKEKSFPQWIAAKDVPIENIDKRIRFLQERGLFKDDVLKHFKIGLTPLEEGKNVRVYDAGYRVSIPFDEMTMDSDMIVGFNYRKIWDLVDPTFEKEQTRKLLLEGKKKIPKYINTCDSKSPVYGNHINIGTNHQGQAIFQSKYAEIYAKSKYIYNFSRAAKYIYAKNTVIVVEGTLDVISLYQAGIENVVSSLTCNMGMEQIEFIASTCKNVVLWYDKDRAGHKHLPPIIKVFLNKGCNVSICYPEYESDGNDPDEVCRKNNYSKEAVLKYLNNSIISGQEFLTKPILSPVASKIKTVKVNTLSAIKNSLEGLNEEMYNEILNDARDVLRNV